MVVKNQGGRSSRVDAAVAEDKPSHSDTQRQECMDRVQSYLESAAVASASQCPDCGSLLRPEAPEGLCSTCLYAVALAAPISDSKRAAFEAYGSMPKRVGRYQIIELLGEGGMSHVYRARQLDSEDGTPLDDDVALKLIKPELLRYSEIVGRFRKAVELAGKLQHASIIRVLDRSGLYEQNPHYTMQLVAGGTLADQHRQDRFRDPKRAARLMIRIARAVQFAHEHGVMHRDLKPDNILLDIHDNPYVTDFMAKRIDRRAERIGREVSTSIVGALGYMAPEQASGEAVTIAADVYGLGAIFYEILTGRPPVQATTLDEAVAQHASGVLVPPRKYVPVLDRSLEAICLAALDKEPTRRFRSAAQFAESLESVLNCVPPAWPEIPPHRRFGMWVRRHPLLAASAVLGALLLLLADVAIFAGARLQRDELRNATLRSNAALATSQARAVLATLEKYTDHAAQGAADPLVQKLLAEGASLDPSPVLRGIYDRALSFGPDAVFLLDSNAVLVRRWPSVPADSVGLKYDFRDYYRCARALTALGSRNVCISPAYRSESDQAIQFAFSTPVYDARGRWLGVLVISRNAARTFGEIDFYGDHDSVTTVFGGRGADRKRPAKPDELIAVVHPELHSTDEVALNRENPVLAEQLIVRFNLRTSGGHFAPKDARPYRYDDYRDPLSRTHERWLAGFAPVGQTGYVLAVATAYEKALGPNQRLIDSLSSYGGALNLSFLVIVAIAFWASLREPRSADARAGGG
jgi:serine/threonine-protein kinase